ncbi:MAG: hypothetical protein QM758_05790 [Armatimonas sp.]
MTCKAETGWERHHRKEEFTGEVAKSFPMNLRLALIEQYRAGLGMLAQCVEICPDDLWTAGTPPREFWRIVWHTAYFTQNYLVQTEDEFNRSAGDWPEAVRSALGVNTTQRAMDVEPYERPAGITPLTRQELGEYIEGISRSVDSTVEGLDLDREDTGFSWYPNMTKLSHELMNLRHIQGHVGQLSELLMARGIDIDWISNLAS